MKIASLDFEIIRATPAIAEFLVRVHLDDPRRECEVTGRVVGPHCPGISTVEVAYPMTVLNRSVSSASLRCVIPEPNLWKPDAPFAYAVSVEVRVNGEVTDTRDSVLALRR